MGGHRRTPKPASFDLNNPKVWAALGFIGIFAAYGFYCLISDLATGIGAVMVWASQ